MAMGGPGWESETVHHLIARRWWGGPPVGELCGRRSVGVGGLLEMRCPRANGVPTVVMVLLSAIRRVTLLG
jgi:hypothetical protein